MLYFPVAAYLKNSRAAPGYIKDENENEAVYRLLRLTARMPKTPEK
jgi:hypothetical protein